MGMYNVLFGSNPAANELLAIIGVDKAYFVRFRDCWVDEQGHELHVYTRLGGGNRSAYTEVWAKIRQHALYVRDFDDQFDETYATIIFTVPQFYWPFTASYANGQVVSGDERWREFFAQLDKERKK